MISLRSWFDQYDYPLLEDKLAGNNGDGIEEGQWTVSLGKNVSYNPSPFRSREDFTRNTIFALIILAIGIYLLITQKNALGILGWLIAGSMIFFYFLSVYETHLFDKKQKEKLR
jgi:hypothetical protein